MPMWLVPQRELDLPRNIALLDTNVLVALFDEADPRHADTGAAIDLAQFTWGVSYAAIIEAWNFLVGKVKRTDYAIRMMEWILTPGNVALIADEYERVDVAHGYSRKFGVDIVDATLLDLAHRITQACSLSPSVHVATYDAKDFLRLFGRQDLQFNVYDMRDLSSTTGE